MKKPTTYKLTAEDLTGLGGPMGSEHTETMFEKYFSNVDSAKTYALKNYKKDGKDEEESIPWRKEKKRWTSGDLRWVMYTISPVEVEE